MLFCLLPAACSQVLSSIRDTAAGLISLTGQRAGRAEPDWKTCLTMLAEAKRTLIEALAVSLHRYLVITCWKEKYGYNVFRNTGSWCSLRRLLIKSSHVTMLAEAKRTLIEALAVSLHGYLCHNK